MGSGDEVNEPKSSSKSEGEAEAGDVTFRRGAWVLFGAAALFRGAFLDVEPEVVEVAEPSEATIPAVPEAPAVTDTFIGSGTSEDAAHFFKSYFVRMKFSIFRPSGTYPSGNFASQ